MGLDHERRQPTAVMSEAKQAMGGIAFSWDVLRGVNDVITQLSCT